MDRLLERKRLLVRLGDRHHLAVIAIVAPAGFGKSVLIGHALAEGPSKLGDRDVSYVCGSEDSKVGHFARALIRSCGDDRAGGKGTELAGPDAGATGVLEALQARGAGRHVALIIDNVERSGSEGEDLLRALLERLPTRCHLVIAGRRLPRIGVTSHIAAGTGLLIDIRELAFSPDELSTLGETSPAQNLSNRELATWPALASLILQNREDLVGQYIDEMILEHSDPDVAKAMAAIASVAGCQDSSLEAVIGAALEGSSAYESPLIDNSTSVSAVVRELRRLPLVDTRDGIWPHPIWSTVTHLMLTPGERERIV